MPVLGILAPRIPELDAFLDKLRELGYVDGRTIRIERRTLAAELVHLGVDVIFAASMPSALAAKNATGTIPVVFEMLGDPLATELVETLARPGSNVTGIAAMEVQLAPRRLQLIKEAVPRAARVAVLRNPSSVGSLSSGLRRTARKLSLRVRYVDARRADDLEGAFIAMVRRGADAMLTLADPLFDAERTRIVALAEKVHLPAIYPFSGMTEIGGLMAYAPNPLAMYRDAAVYVAKILKGAKPGDLPVAQPSKLDLAVNLNAAAALNLTLPQALLARADSVIK